jgi:zinc protease
MKFKLLLGVMASLVVSHAAWAGIADQAVRAKAAGIDVITYPMGVKDVVTLVGSMPAGNAYASQSNLAVATVAGLLLDKGTTKQDKLSIAKQLDDVGAQLGFSVGSQTLEVSGRFLKKDLPLVVRLLAEELRMPAFSNEELAKAKTQLEAALRQAQQDTNARAREGFSRAVFASGHPNREFESKEWMDAIAKVTADDLRAFHKKYYGPSRMTLVFVGDVNAAQARKEVTKAFGGWSGGVDLDRKVKDSVANPQREQTVAMADKTSVSVLLGQATGLRYMDADSLALRVGTAILGSGFTSRLVKTVRDQEGLTYGVGAGVDDDTFVDGSWMVRATFAPALLQKGITSTRRELDKWYESGVTADELAARKTNMIGEYQVSLASTGGMASAILRTVNRGKDLKWMDEYPKAIEALTVEQVNAAIRKHLDPQKMVLLEAGTLP